MEASFAENWRLSDDPDGRVADVIYPVAGAAKLKAVIDGHRAKFTKALQSSADVYFSTSRTGEVKEE